MILDRIEFLSAINFIKHVIPDSDDSGKSCLFVRVEDDKLVLIGGGEFAAKRVVMLRPITTEEAAKDQKKASLPANFMIPKASLLSFETLMQKHKKKAKKLAKNDESFLYIDVDDKELESFGVVLTYPQPSYLFKDMENLFQHKKGMITDVPVLSGDMEAIMKGFSKSKNVKITFSGDGEPMHFYQESTQYEAILIPPANDESDDE
ncbi:MAG: hypothetical protein DRP56_09745 [Planctomycetota bacterium]|nr:MAG: hypothetical protein DRP56_09745 [Planctomycetota bacterium]